MIGDSWGVPNYEGPPGSPPDTHTEFLLKEKGYKVYNCSLNGGSNCRSIETAKSLLAGEPIVLEPIYLNNKLYPYNIETVIEKNYKIDVFIWFHTEFFRGPYTDKKQKIDYNIEYSANINYQMAADFFKEHPHAKTIVIGGQSPVVTDILYKYMKPDYLIQDWRSEIIGTKLPEVHTLTKPDLWIDRSPDSTEFKIRLLEKHKVIMDAMYNSPDFPDNCHPGAWPHKVLAERLHKVISRMFHIDSL